MPFSDDFGRSDQTGLGDNWYTVPEVGYGWNISDDAAVSNGFLGHTNISTVNGISATDVSVTATLVPGGGSSTSAGLVARMTADGGYAADVQNQLGTISVYIQRIGPESATSATTVETIASDGDIATPSSPYTVTFQVYGDRLALYVNGTLLLTTTDDTFSGPGTVGIYANGGGETIEDFSAAVTQPPAPTNASLPFTDDFNRADSIYVGSSWTVQQGSMAISDDQVTNINQSSSADMTLNGVSATDVVLSGQIDTPGPAIGLMARMNGGDGYMAQISDSYFAQILREDDGTWTVLSSQQLNGLPATGTLRFELRGSSLALYLNGIPVGQATDTTYSGPGAVGVWLGPGAFDEFLTDFSAEVAPSPPTPENASLPFSDSFDRPDSSSISPYWTVLTGSAVIGQDQLLTSYGQTEAIVNGISATNVNITSNIDLNIDTYTGDFLAGLEARVSGDSEYRATIEYAVNNLYPQPTLGFEAAISVEVDGVWTQLDTRQWNWPLASGQPTDVGTGNLRFDLDGSELGLYLNNTLVASADDSSVTGPGTIGIFGSGPVGFSNFAASVFSSDQENATLSASQPFTDDFNRPDNAVVLGPSWVQQTGDMAVFNDQLAEMSAGNSVAALLGIAQADVVLSARVNLLNKSVDGARRPLQWIRKRCQLLRGRFVERSMEKPRFGRS